MKSVENKILKRNVSLFLAAFMYSLAFAIIAIGIGYKDEFVYKTLVIGLIGITFLVGSFASFCLSKNKVSDIRYYIYLVILIILFVLALVLYSKGYSRMEGGHYRLPSIKDIFGWL